VLEQNNWTVLVFSKWMQCMTMFKKDFEIRRIIFGLTEILKVNP
jgi:hypothetical protein